MSGALRIQMPVDPAAAERRAANTTDLYHDARDEALEMRDRP